MTIIPVVTDKRIAPGPRPVTVGAQAPRLLTRPSTGKYAVATAAPDGKDTPHAPSSRRYTGGLGGQRGMRAGTDAAPLRPNDGRPAPEPPSPGRGRGFVFALRPLLAAVAFRRPGPRGPAPPSQTPRNSHNLAGGAPIPIAGGIGQPTTTVLFGGSSNNTVRSGARLRAGGWLDECNMLGVEGSFFFLGNQAQNFTSVALANNIVTRPFFNTSTGLEDVQIVNFPG